MKMNTYLQSLFTYFENVLHPAGGVSDRNIDKKKRKVQRLYETNMPASPESFNMRAVAKKQDKIRRNPAP